MSKFTTTQNFLDTEMLIWYVPNATTGHDLFVFHFLLGIAMTKQFLRLLKLVKAIAVDKIRGVIHHNFFWMVHVTQNKKQ
jgi:5,10-methylenetetrahydrofolate reductase